MTGSLSLPDFDDVRRAATVFDETAVWASNLYVLGGEGAGEQVRGATVSDRFFPMLGGAAVGRVLSPADARDKVVVLGHGLWTRRFGADPGLVGRTIRLSGEAYTVIGVMGPDFQFPSGQFDLWVPIESAMAKAPEQMRNRSLRIFRLLGRLAPGVTLAQAQGQVSAIAARLAKEHPATNEGIGITVASVYDRLVGGVRTALLVLMGVVALVLLIACANVANLLLARAAVARAGDRHPHRAGRRARTARARQLLTESVLLSAAGSLVGLLLARWILDALPGLAGAGIPRLASVRIDLGVLAFTGAIAVATGLLFGLAPAWQAARADAAHGLREGGRGSAGPASRRLRAGLTAAEVALALVVLVGAGLLVQSLVRLLHVDAGFTADGLLTFNVGLFGPTPRTPPQRAALAQEIVTRVSRLPGVEAAGGGTGLPPLTAQRATGFAAEGLAEGAAEARRAYFLAVTPDYFRALGTRVYEGRAFTDADGAGAPEVVVVNHSLARRLYGEASAVGRRIRLVNPEYGDGWRTVIGVVGDVRYSGLDDPGEAAVYTPFAQTPFLWTYVMVRTSGPPMALATAIREAVTAVDPTLEAAALKPMTEVMAETVAQPRFNVVLLSAFAGLALVLAAVGIYGVISYSVGAADPGDRDPHGPRREPRRRAPPRHRRRPAPGHRRRGPRPRGRGRQRARPGQPPVRGAADGRGDLRVRGGVPGAGGAGGHRRARMARDARRSGERAARGVGGGKAWRA